MNLRLRKNNIDFDWSEEEFENFFRILREREFGVTCKKCGSKNHYWKKDKKLFECITCGFRTTLKSGTIMHKSKLPIKFWYLALYYYNRLYSIREIQNILNHNRYEPIYRMIKKIEKQKLINNNFNLAMEINEIYASDQDSDRPRFT